MIRADIPMDSVAHFDARSGKHPKRYLNHHEVKGLELSLQCGWRNLPMIKSIWLLWPLHWPLICRHSSVSDYETLVVESHLDKACRSSPTRPEEGAQGDGCAPPQGRRAGVSEVKAGGVGGVGATLDLREDGCLLMRSQSIRLSLAVKLSTASTSGDDFTVRSYDPRNTTIRAEVSGRLSEETNMVPHGIVVFTTCASIPITPGGNPKTKLYPGKPWGDCVSLPCSCNSDPPYPLIGALSLTHEVAEEMIFFPEGLGSRAQLLGENPEWRETIFHSRCDCTENYSVLHVVYVEVAVLQDSVSTTGDPSREVFSGSDQKRSLGRAWHFRVCVLSQGASTVHWPMDVWYDLDGLGQVPFMEIMDLFLGWISPPSPLPSIFLVFMVSIAPKAVETVLVCKLTHENVSSLDSHSQNRCLGIRLTSNQPLLVLGVVQ